MEVEITIDRGLCIGSGQCVHLAPQTFDQDEQALAYLVDPPGTADDRTLRAITGCPMQAIALEIDGVVVTAEELQNWVSGLRSNDPLVEVIGSLSESHHELREAMAGAGAGVADGGVEAMAALTTAHLAEEDDAYEAITSLVDPALVRAFEADREQITAALDALSAGDPLDPGRDHVRSVTALAASLEEHIRMEEAVLFPLALAALARQSAHA